MTHPTILAGAESSESFAELLERVAREPAWRPFDPRAVSFAARLSRRLLTDRRIREFPELAALAHWFRQARIDAMAEAYATERAGTYTVGRGLAFHLAPSNVDSVSVYSWLLSLLAGNTNIVRVSQRLGAQLQLFLEIMTEVAREPGHAAVASRIIIVTYPHDEVTTRMISARCHLRVIWGGDATVATIRGIPLRPTALEVAFPDRFSLAAINAVALLGLDASSLDQLASRFYNDAFWFAQQACSSPRTIYWVGTPESCASAQQRFWDAVEREIARRQPENTPAMVMARIAAAFELAGMQHAQPSHIFRPSSLPMRLTLERGLGSEVKDRHCGNGLFLEDSLSVLSELASHLTDREQTLSIFGFDRATVTTLLEALPSRALDRIVPIGKALDFSPVWDGFDLVDTFARRIEIIDT